MKVLSMVKLLTCIALFTCILLVTACGGVTIKPDGDGGVTVTPNENENNNGGGGNSGSTDGGNNGGGSGNNDSNNEIHSHVYELVKSDSSSSCTEDVVRTWKCECGSEFTETFAAPGHDIRSYEGKAATCTEDGYKPYEKCIRGDCGYTTYEAIPAIGHDLEYSADIQPTCTEKGAYDRAQCKREGCGYSTENVIAALGHIRQIVEGKPATCTEAGYLSYEICTRSGCDGTGIEKPTVIDALGHDDVHYSAKAPTCTEFGWNEYDVCHRCSRSTYEKLDAKGHTDVNGYCGVCGVAIGTHTHIWDGGEITLSATCTTAGMITYTCTDENCGDTKTDEISALGHNNQSYATKAPTCTTDGWHAYEECSRCGYSTYSVDPALGHTYDNGTITANPTCTESGERTFTCVRGDNSFKVAVEALGHNFGNWTVVIAPTCDSWGQEQKVCSHDNSHIETRAIDMLGHDYGDWFVYIEETCTKNGEERQVCKNDSSHIITTVIPAHGHDVDNSTGECNICGDVVKPPLATPEISYCEDSIVYWGIVEGADHYEVYIANSGNTVTTYNTFVDLKDYYGTNTVLQLFITAIPAENEENIKSSPLQHIFKIPTGSMANYEGLGMSVNLLNNSYINYANVTSDGKSISIFNKILWDRLDATKSQITDNPHDTEIIYSESIEGYTNKLSESIGNKISVNGSVGYGDIAKVTSGYSFEVNDSYSRKAYNQTQAIFYDMNYFYRGYQAGIDGYMTTEYLSTLLSEQFISDVELLRNGTTTFDEEDFINKYGTHVITSAIYGATFRAHFESLMDKSDVESTFGTSIEESISAGIAGTIGGVKVDVNTNVDKKAEVSVFKNVSTSDLQSKFTVYASGGNLPANMAMTSLADFSDVCQNWANSIEDETGVRLVDVPDGSLYFVWDFLDDSYSDVKKQLSDYFISRCKGMDESLKSKINGIYKDFFDFDEKTGNLTFNLSGLQKPFTDKTSLKDVLYKDGDIEIFNGATGKFTICSKFSGHDVKKVIFEGGYLTYESQNNNPIDAIFDDVYIVFNESWTADRDIVVEFKNFAYEAPAGYSALDFSAASSEDITIIVTGNSYIRSGDGASSCQAGLEGINASGKNLLIEGTGSLKIVAGNGIKGYNGGEGARGGNGGNGGDGIIANKVYVTISALDVTGGNGANGGNGGGNVYGYGGDGGDAGKGGNAISTTVLTINSNFINLTGGNGANGGNGGDDTSWTGRVDGDGGKGGNGGFAVSPDAITNIFALNAVLIGGNGGSGGGGQDNGTPGASGTSASPKAQIYIENKRYTLYETSKTWTDAKSSTENNGAYLATITSEQEQEIINELLSYGTLNNYYIGAYRAVDDANVWEWVTGEQFSFTNWHSGEPNNDSYVEDYVGIYKDKLAWNDYPLDQKHGYIEECDLVFDEAVALQ